MASRSALIESISNGRDSLSVGPHCKNPCSLSFAVLRCHVHDLNSKHEFKITSTCFGLIRHQGEKSTGSDISGSEQVTPDYAQFLQNVPVMGAVCDGAGGEHGHRDWDQGRTAEVATGI